MEAVEVQCPAQREFVLATEKTSAKHWRLQTELTLAKVVESSQLSQPCVKSKSKTRRQCLSMTKWNTYVIRQRKEIVSANQTNEIAPASNLACGT